MVILASASPRRRELLTMAGIEFRVEAADIDEAVQPGESPADVCAAAGGGKGAGGVGAV